MNYWKQQNEKEPLFPDVLWSKPEQKNIAGKLGIVGGNSLGFAAVANAYKAATDAGVGEVKLVLPQSLKKPLGLLPGVEFAPDNQSGGLSKNALPQLKALSTETDGLLLIGDAGKNSETQTLYETFVREMDNNNKPLIVSRDAVDLLMGVINELIIRDNTLLVLSFSQLQKIFQNLYYPIVLVHSIQNNKLVEALHKFTISNQATVAVFHDDLFLIASKGEVVSSRFSHPTNIWQGKTAAQIASWFLWNPLRPLEATATAILAK